MQQRDDVDLTMPFQNRAHEALISVWWTGMLLKRRSRSFFDSIGTTEADFHLMMVVKNTEELLTQNALGKKLMVDKSNMTGRIDSLEKRGFLKRGRVEGDRRSYHIVLTSKGRKFVGASEGSYMDAIGEIMKPFKQKESVELTRLCHKLREGLVDFSDKEAE